MIENNQLGWIDYAGLGLIIPWIVLQIIFPEHTYAIHLSFFVLFGILIMVDMFIVQPIKHHIRTKKKIELVMRTIVKEKKPYKGDFNEKE